jgi:hypothetical protein
MCFTRSAIPIFLDSRIFGQDDTAPGNATFRRANNHNRKVIYILPRVLSRNTGSSATLSFRLVFAHAFCKVPAFTVSAHVGAEIPWRGISRDLMRGRGEGFAFRVVLSSYRAFRFVVHGPCMIQMRPISASMHQDSREIVQADGFYLLGHQTRSPSSFRRARNEDASTRPVS